MDAYRGTVYTPAAEAQLEALLDEDIRYQLEPEQYEWLLERDAEGLGTPTVIEGEAVYVFVTVPKPNGPRQLAITYRLLSEDRMVQIMDIRPLP
jgi:hypothetical protein